MYPPPPPPRAAASAPFYTLTSKMKYKFGLSSSAALSPYLHHASSLHCILHFRKTYTAPAP